MKLFNSFKKHPRFSLALLGLFLILGLYLFLTPQKTAPTPSTQSSPSSTTPPETGPTPSWQGITPNSTSLKELLATLGEPVSQETVGDKTIYNFESPYLGFFNQVSVQNDRVTLAREIFQNNLKSPTTIANRLPEPRSAPTLKYLQEYGEDMPLYIYPQDGLAFVAHNSNQTIFEVWYFKPTDINSFINSQNGLIKDREEVQSQF